MWLEIRESSLLFSSYLRLVFDQDDPLLDAVVLSVHGPGLGLVSLVLVAGAGLVAGVLPVLLARPLHHPAPVLLPVHPGLAVQ